MDSNNLDNMNNNDNNVTNPSAAATGNTFAENGNVNSTVPMGTGYQQNAGNAYQTGAGYQQNAGNAYQTGMGYQQNAGNAYQTGMGYQQGNGYGYNYGNPGYDNGYGIYDEPGKGTATASLVLGIISLVFCWMYLASFLGIITGIVGIICASNSYKAGNTSGVQKAGLVCSIIGLSLSSIVFVSCVACLGFVDMIERY